MCSFAKNSLVMLLLVFAASLLAAPPEPEDPYQKAQAAILKLADNLNAADVPARAQTIVKEHASESISSVFMRKNVGGLGIGNAAKTDGQNSIERLVREWTAGRAADRDSLEKHHAEYLKVTRAIRAMAELAPYRMPDRVAQRQDSHAEWLRVSAEFKTAAAEMDKAVQLKNPVQIKKAAGQLNHTCCDCHTLRD